MRLPHPDPGAAETRIGLRLIAASSPSWAHTASHTASWSHSASHAPTWSHSASHAAPWRRHVRKHHPSFSRPLLHCFVMLQAESLPFLSGFQGTHLCPVFSPLLRRHELAAIDLLLRLNLVCGQGRRRKRKQGKKQNRYFHLNLHRITEFQYRSCNLSLDKRYKAMDNRGWHWKSRRS